MSGSTGNTTHESQTDRGQATASRMPVVGQLFAFVSMFMAGLFEGANRAQMGAKRIGSLAIGISVIGIVLNQMDSISVFNSSGVIDVSAILSVAGDGLQLLVVGVIIAAAAVLLNLWSGF